MTILKNKQKRQSNVLCVCCVYITYMPYNNLKNFTFSLNRIKFI